MSYYSRRYRNRYSYGGFPPYVSVAERRQQAKKKIATLQKKGKSISPIEITGRNISHTFWGKAWCKNLDSYSDYDNRLPRGRSYVRHGAVLDLQIEKGRVEALVHGSSVYKVTIQVNQLVHTKWQAIVKQCAGQIDSLVELLQGRFPKKIMEIIANQSHGLFPHFEEIQVNCSCPDYANICKHVAAVFYGIGARLDDNPELLFLLRQVDHHELITIPKTIDSITTKSQKMAADQHPVLDSDELSSIFGIDIDNNKTKIEKTTKRNKTTKTKETKNKTAKTKKVVKRKGMQTKKVKANTTKQTVKTKTSRKTAIKKATKTKTVKTGAIKSVGF